MVIGRNDLQPYELDWREFAIGRTCKNVRNVRLYSRTCSETITYFTYLSNGVNQEKTHCLHTKKSHRSFFSSFNHADIKLPSSVLLCCLKKTETFQRRVPQLRYDN